MNRARVSEVRARVRAARAVVAATSGRVETLARDRYRAARFYSRFGATDDLLRHGARASEASPAEPTVRRIEPVRPEFHPFGKPEEPSGLDDMARDEGVGATNRGGTAVGATCLCREST